MTQQSELGGRMVGYVMLVLVSRWAGFQAERQPQRSQHRKRSHCNQCHGYCRLGRSDSLLSAVLAAPAIWPPPWTQQPVPTQDGTSRRRFSFVSPHLLCEKLKRVRRSMWFPDRHSRHLQPYLDRKRSRWLCRQRACVCQPMEQERLEGLPLRGGAETQREATGVGGWGWGKSDGV